MVLSGKAPTTTRAGGPAVRSDVRLMPAKSATGRTKRNDSRTRKHPPVQHILKIILPRMERTHDVGQAVHSSNQHLPPHGSSIHQSHFPLFASVSSACFFEDRASGGHRFGRWQITVTFCLRAKTHAQAFHTRKTRTQPKTSRFITDAESQAAAVEHSARLHVPLRKTRWDQSRIKRPCNISEQPTTSLLVTYSSLKSI